MLVLAVSSICTWLVLTGILVVLILMAKSLEYYHYRDLLNYEGECQGCYMLREINKCTNPECKHYSRYVPPTPEEIADGVVKFSELLEDDDGPGHTLYQ